MGHFLSLKVESRIIGNGVEEVFYPVNRLAKIEHSPGGGSIVTLYPETTNGQPEVVTSTETPADIIGKVNGLTGFMAV